jgi:hypothetical protein
MAATDHPPRRLTVRSACELARDCHSVRTHVVDRHWLAALWTDGTGHERHVPSGLLLAVGRRDAAGALTLYLSRAVPGEGSHVRALLPVAIVTAATGLRVLNNVTPSGHVQVAMLYVRGACVLIEQCPRPRLLL